MPDAATSYEITTTQEVLDQADRALELARKAGADEAVARVSRRRGLEFQWRDTQLERVQENARLTLTVSLYVDGRYSTHTTHDLQPDRLEAFLAEAVALTRHLEPDPYRRMTDAKLYEGRSDVDLDLVDPAIPALTRRQRIEWCKTMHEAATADESVVSATTQVHDAHGVAARVSSNGFRGAEEETTVVYGTGVTIREGETKRPEDHWFVAGTHIEGLPSAHDVGAEALRRTLDRRGATKVDSLRTTMIVHPEAGASLVGRMLGALTAGSVQQGRSFLAEKQGAELASSVLTLVDEPLVPRGLGSRLFDGEGIAARPLVLVEDGILRSYLVDTYYGRKLGWDPTTGAPSNLVVKPGEADLETLLADVDDGILVTSWLGGNANLTSGDYSFGVRGHRIRGGKRAEPVSEMNVTGNYLDLFGRLAVVGNDPVPWHTCRTPTLVFSDVQFSGN